MCKLEPIVDIIVPGEEKITYVKVTPEIAVKIVNDHIVNKNIVSEYTIGNAE
jgi:NADP-reducing hydrogenase subunit HndB